jgi:hypothetical protein
MEEAVMAYFKVLYRHLPGGTEKSHKKPQTSWYMGKDYLPTISFLLIV